MFGMHNWQPSTRTLRHPDYRKLTTCATVHLVQVEQQSINFYLSWCYSVQMLNRQPHRNMAKRNRPRDTHLPVQTHKKRHSLSALDPSRFYPSSSFVRIRIDLHLSAQWSMIRVSFLSLWSWAWKTLHLFHRMTLYAFGSHRFSGVFRTIF